jgi:4-amino-4-deoxy-L-arabinose transferase-like glycosyltransferase
VWLLALLFALALLPRVLPAPFWTTDEARHWSGRAQAFAQALREGDYAATNQTGHPGVTTMWLGAAGVLAYDALVQQGRAAPLDPAFAQIAAGDYGAAAALFQAAQGDFARYLWLLRLPVALLTALWVALCYPLLRRLFAARVALLAVLLLATCPFLVAHARVLHLDALLTACMSLALLSGLLAFRLESRPAALPAPAAPPETTPAPLVHWRWLLASALAGGLALLTKSPSVLLLPMLALFGLVALLRARRAGQPLAGLLAALCGAGALWALVALLVCVTLWPALWVAPWHAVQAVIDEAAANGGTPHANGSFFLGRALPDPGWLFYTVALPLRWTPWLLLGMLAALLPARQREQGRGPALALLLVFALLLLLALSAAPKKFDRYALPAFPVFAILAAVGWARLLDRLPARVAGALWGTTGRGLLTGAVLAALLALHTLAYQPYYLAYYNPLLGGGSVAARSVPVGWGEGLAQAGAYIQAQPNGCDHALASWYEEVILPHSCTAVMDLAWATAPDQVEYAVLYVNQVQRDIYADVTAALRAQGPPVHTVRLHGITYAEIYQRPRPLTQRLAADFGTQIRLVGYEIDAAQLASAGRLMLTTQWQARAEGDQDYMLFIHLLDAQGNRIAQADVPPAGPAAPTAQWRAHHYYQWQHPLLVGEPLPAGTYWLALGLYRPQDVARLPLHLDDLDDLDDADAPPPGAPAAPADALLLGPLVIE